MQYSLSIGWQIMISATYVPYFVSFIIFVVIKRAHLKMSSDQCIEFAYLLLLLLFSSFDWHANTGSIPFHFDMFFRLESFMITPYLFSGYIRRDWTCITASKYRNSKYQAITQFFHEAEVPKIKIHSIFNLLMKIYFFKCSHTLMSKS